ncbi:MAG: CHAP domain-containing protein [Planctomycetes bacterium]|nr:CHAP domain-containing protein [Planctomycetota bacterium]
MSFEHFERFFAVTAIGLGLLLAGGLNLAFGRGGRRVWLRTSGTLAACGAAVAGLSVLTRPELALRNGGILLGVLAAATLLGSEWFSRRVAALFARLRGPAVRWGLVALSGLGAVLIGAIAFEKNDEAATDQQMKDLELLLGKPNTKPSDRARASTDRGTPVVLREPVGPREPGELLEPEDKTLRNANLHTHVIRRSPPHDGANCHGWVFTGGKFHLSPDDVEAILKENGYQEVHQPQAGDVAIYRQGGAIAHTAIVRYVAEGQPVMVEGKWGTLGVYLHPADKSCYGTAYTFHRSARTGHLLVGLGGSPGTVETTNATAE